MNNEVLGGRPVPSRLAFFKDFFLFIIRTISLRLLNLTITLLLRPLSSDFNLWHALIFCGSTAASILSKTFNTVLFKSICSILWGIPEIIHSLLEYCSFSQHFPSNLVTWSTSLLLTFLGISRSDSSLGNLFFKSSSSEFILFSAVCQMLSQIFPIFPEMQDYEPLFSKMNK